MKKFFILAHDQARANAVRAVEEAEEGLTVTIEAKKRSNDQNAKIHALLTEYGEIKGWMFNGVPVDLDDLKSIFMAAYRKLKRQQSRFAIGFDGQPVVLNWRTRDLEPQEASEFIELVSSYLAELE